MTGFTDADARNEAEMASLGVERYKQKRSKAQDRGKESETPVGRHLLRETVAKMEVEVRRWIKGARRKPGRNHGALQYLELLRTPVIALITARHVLDSASGLGEGQPFGSVAISLGRRLEDEHRYNVFKRDAGMAWGRLMHDQRRAGYTHFRTAAIHKAGQVGVRTDPWPVREKARVGAVCLELLMGSTGLVEVREWTARGKTSKYLVVPDSVLDWMVRSHEAHEVMAPFYMPTLSPPRDWTTLFDGGYHTDLSQRQPMVNVHTRAGLEHLEAADLTRPTAAVNYAQRTPWRVNPDVLAVVEELWSSGSEVAGLPSRQRDELPPRPVDIAENEEARTTWRREAAQCYSKEVAQKTSRMQVERTLFMARKFPGVFHFPQKLDWRGRMYPLPTFLTPQGSDLARGLLTFAHPEPADLSNLAVHGANAWGLDKTTIADRVAWVAENEGQVKEVYRDPLGCDWWTGAEEPWQFLAFCLDYGEALDTGMSRLPCASDATNNGLQIFSLLLRDSKGARSTNVAPSDGVRDVYADVAGSVMFLLNKGDRVADEESIWAQWYWFLVRHCGGTLPREAVKRSVMTLPYGSTQYACQRYVLDWYEALDVPEDQRPWPPGRTTYQAVQVLSALVWQAIHDTVPGAVDCMNWLRGIADVFTAQQRAIKWISPSGFAVTQLYHRYRTKEVRTAIGESVKWIKYRQSTDRIDGKKQANGISPNFVHSLDAACLTLALNRLESLGVPAISTVHDAYATHSCYVPLKHVALRESYLEVFRENQLGRLLHQLRAQAGELPPPPALGDLNVDDLMESTYMFS